VSRSTDLPTPAPTPTLPYVIAVTVVVLLTIVLYLWQQVEAPACEDDPSAPLRCQPSAP
jgi:hypothetical protein